MANKTGRWLALAIAVLLIPAMAGCGSEYGERNASNYGSKKGGAVTEDSYRAYGTQQRDGAAVIHQNSTLQFSQSLSDGVSALNGVSTSYVMRTDRNAYVAVMLDNSAAGTRGAGARKETNNSGTSLGTYHAHNFTQGLDGNLITNGYNSYDTVENHADLSHGLKQAIALKIRQLDPSVHDVYISANRDFVNRMNMYAQESWKGNSLQPYLADFNGWANRLFGIPESGPVATPRP